MAFLELLEDSCLIGTGGTGLNVATVAGGVVALFIAAAALVGLRGRGATPGAIGRMWRRVAFAVAAGIAIALLPYTVEDSGAAAGYLLGVPVVAAGCALIADVAHRAVGVTTTIAALVTLVWALLLGLGIGLWFVLPALLLGIAAVATPASRRATVPSDGAPGG